MVLEAAEIFEQLLFKFPFLNFHFNTPSRSLPPKRNTFFNTMRLVTCDRVMGVERPFLELQTALNVDTDADAKHWYTKDQISLNYDDLKPHGVLSPFLDACLSSLNLSDDTTEDQYEILFHTDGPFAVTLVRLGSVALLASTGINTEARSSVAVEQNVRIEKLSDMIAAGGTLTIEQEAYVKMVMSGDYDGWLWWVLGQLIPIL